MKKLNFTSVIKFCYNNQKYEMFKTFDERLAFLKIKNNKYSYPTKEEFESLLILFNKYFDKNISMIENKKIKFLPLIKNKAKNKTFYLMITSALVFSTLTGCANTNNTNTYSYDDAYLEVNENNFEENIPVQELDLYSNEFRTMSLYDILKTNSLSIADTSKNDLQDNYEYALAYEDVVYDESSNTIYLFNDKYFDYVFEKKECTIVDVYDYIDNNNSIDKDTKKFIKDYVFQMFTYYGIDLRVFGENIKNTKFNYLDESDIVSTYNCTACFDAEKNELFLPNKLDLNDSQSKIILRHELGHLFNNINIKKDDYNIIYYFNYNNHGKYLKEALNTIFTYEPFKDEYEDVSELNKGYQLTTNYVEILTDIIDYDYQDFVRSNVYGFENYVRITANNDTNFNAIEDILEYQYVDLVSDNFELDESYYVSFYKYIANLYIDKYLDYSMSDERIMKACESLKQRLKTDVTNTDFIKDNVIDSIFNEYLEKAASLRNREVALC